VTVPILTFFNNKGGVGKTSLVYHLAWMFADLGCRVVAVDLDPQANLTSAFLDDDELEALWKSEGEADTVYEALRPLIRAVGDVVGARLRVVVPDRLALLPGDLSLTLFEDQLSETWPKCLSGDERAFRVTSAFWRICEKAAAGYEADLVLMDLGPNLGAANRAALIAADHVVIPLAPDLFSLQGLTNLGPTLRRWRREWQESKVRNPAADLRLPEGKMSPIGYVVQQHSVRLDRPTRAYDRWASKIPDVYRTDVLGEAGDATSPSTAHQLALLKHYRSLMAMAQEARKPIFHLQPADGAIGAHYYAVQDCRRDFKELATRIAERIGLNLPRT
jgi:cellulose biosynthesis protein BcsQ